MNPRENNEPYFRLEGWGIISTLVQDNSTFKLQYTLFLKFGSHCPPLIAGLFDLQISIHCAFEI
jgi:hypothetical protein